MQRTLSFPRDPVAVIAIYIAFLLQDIDKCIAVMSELDALAVSPLMLKKNPEIVGTVKKVRFITLIIFFCPGYDTIWLMVVFFANQLI